MEVPMCQLICPVCGSPFMAPQGGVTKIAVFCAANGHRLRWFQGELVKNGFSYSELEDMLCSAEQECDSAHESTRNSDALYVAERRSHIGTRGHVTVLKRRLRNARAEIQELRARKGVK